MFTLKHNYAVSALYNQPTESLKGFLTKRWSFWLALFSCIAFLVGNMVGQHGWKTFWKSVWGAESQIVFTGTVYPLPKIPDPNRWGGSIHEYNFQDVPASLLMDFPAYRPVTGCDPQSHDRRIISVDYMGDYDSGGLNCGSHLAADILVPKGTPVVAMANGIVDRVEVRDWGFGNTIVIRHPNVPDPDDSTRTTTLYSGYAHLGPVIVSAGEVVYKGQNIAVSGKTGLATAPHLHFQLDRASAPFHPFWPFTTAEASEKSLSFTDAVDNGLGRSQAKQYTVNPFAYVQTYIGGVNANPPTIPDGGDSDTIVADTHTVQTATVKVADDTFSLVRTIKIIQSRVAVRKAQRLAQRQDHTQVTVTQASSASAVASPGSGVSSTSSISSSSVSSASSQSSAASEQQSSSSSEITSPQNVPMPQQMGPVATFSILSDGSFDHEWEDIVVFARDGDGKFVKNVHFDGEVALESTFGDAEFAPAVLTQDQFDDHGRAFVKMLPHGQKTIIPSIRGGAFSADGSPMVFAPTAHTMSTRASQQPEG